jgi:hypothetical protein
MSEYKKKINWLVINLDYVLKNYYYEFKCNFNKTLHQENKKFDWGYYETGKVSPRPDETGKVSPRPDETDLILKITDELINGIKNKIQSLISFAQITDNNCVILIHEQYDIDFINWRNLFSNDFKFNHSNNETSNNLYHVKRLNQLLEHDSLLIQYLEENYVYMTTKNVYINDMIAIITKTIEKKHSYNHVIIISNDSAVYQLLNDRINILNIYCDEDATRILSSSEVNLWYHIINGYKNLNISPIMFKASQIYDFIKETNNYHPIIKNETSEFRELNKREIYYVLHNLTDFKKFIETKPDFISNNQHIANQKLLDFNNIPDELHESIKKILSDILQKKQYISTTNKKVYNNCNNTKIQPSIQSTIQTSIQSTIENNHLDSEKIKKMKKIKKSETGARIKSEIKEKLKKSNNFFSVLTIEDNSE